MMSKLIIAFTLFVNLLVSDHPKDVTGKWVVDHVEMTELPKEASLQQKEKMMAILRSSFKNASFLLQSNNKCVVINHAPGIPPINYWTYEPNNGKISLYTDSSKGSKIMVIEVIEHDGKTVFYWKGV